MRKAIYTLTLLSLIFLSDCHTKSANECFIMGNLYSQKGDYKSAIEYYNNAIQKNENNAEYYYQRGIAKYKKSINISFDNKILSDILTDFCTALQLNPDYQAVYVQIINCSKNPNVKKFTIYGLPEYNKFLELEPKSIECLKLKIYIEISYNSNLDAYVDITKIIRIGSKETNLEMYKLRASLDIKMANFNGAIEDINKAIELNPIDSLTQKANLFFIRAKLKSEENDYFGAISDVNISIQISPTNSNYYKFRGEMKDKYNDNNGGQKDFLKAVDLESNHKNIQESKISYNKNGNIEQQTDIVDEALKKGVSTKSLIEDMTKNNVVVFNNLSYYLKKYSVEQNPNNPYAIPKKTIIRILNQAKKQNAYKLKIEGATGKSLRQIKIENEYKKEGRFDVHYGGDNDDRQEVKKGSYDPFSDTYDK